jgi:branched-chain amino acid aminotransferase
MTTGKILGRTYAINGKPADAADFKPDLSADVYYEVVRLQSGKILFMDDHLERFNHTISESGLDYPGDHVVYENLRTLLLNNDLAVGNIRICLQKKEGETPELYCYFVPYIYPEKRMYLSGVQLVTYSHERPNPGIKKWDNSFRVSVQQHIRNHGVYEAILINGKGEITEGSRSNVFFIDPSDRLITPPLKEVLPGITRKYVLRICREQDVEVMERPVSKNELDKLVSCFISGTSPKILPVRQLDGYQFRVDHPLLKQIMERFDIILKENLKTIV